MPPASLSTFDVISPGPTTAKKTASLLRIVRVRRLKFLPRLARRESVSVNVIQVFIAFDSSAQYREISTRD
jgi:hypothetical protein